MKVGIIGLGTMGSRIAANLQKTFGPVAVNTRRKESAAALLDAGMIWADTPKQVAAQSDVLFTVLPGPAEVEAVALGADGIIEGLKPGAAYFDLTTNSPTTVKQVAAQFSDRGLQMLDAPVSGGPKGAQSGKLAIWVGGDEEMFNRYRPVLDAIGDQAMYVGPIGSGSIAKLVHNCTQYAFNCVAAEVFTLGVKAGMEPLALFQAVRQGTLGRRRTFDGLVDQFLPGIYEPANFALALAHKDVALATNLGRELGVPMRMANLAFAEMTEALNRGWGAKDSRVAMLLQEERSGVKIVVEREKIKKALEENS